MTFTVYEPISQCSICGLDFPESEMVRHYRTGRLVDRGCADERTASDNLAILKRPTENRRRAKQPVPSSEESSGEESLVLSTFPLVQNATAPFDFSTTTGPAGGAGILRLQGSISVGYASLVPQLDGIAGLIWRVTFVVNAPHVAKGVVIAPSSGDAMPLVTTTFLEANNPPVFSLSTAVASLKRGKYYEWQYVLRY